MLCSLHAIYRSMQYLSILSLLWPVCPRLSWNSTEPVFSRSILVTSSRGYQSRGCLLYTVPWNLSFIASVQTHTQTYTHTHTHTMSSCSGLWDDASRGFGRILSNNLGQVAYQVWVYTAWLHLFRAITSFFKATSNIIQGGHVIYSLSVYLFSGEVGLLG